MFKLKATNAIQLQGIGWAHALPAGEITPGDVLIWNYGSLTPVLAVREASAKFIEADLQTPATKWTKESTHPRRMMKTRLVGVTRETYQRHHPEDTSTKVDFTIQKNHHV